MRRVLLISLGLIGIAIGCGDYWPPSEHFELSEVLGTYLATFGEGEYIELREDSSFIHTWTDKEESILKKVTGVSVPCDQGTS